MSMLSLRDQFKVPIPDQLRLPASNPLTGVWRDLSRVVIRTVRAGMRYRVMGLAAESAFFAVLSLPPLLFGLSGAIGYIAQRFSVQTIHDFRADILGLAGRFLTSDTVATVIAPTLDEVLASGRAEVVSIGFLLAVWSGSRAMNVFLDTVSIMYGRRGVRGILRTRALSLVMYLLLIILAAVILPLVVAGPSLIEHLVPARLQFLNNLYWPTVLAGSLLSLTALYSLAVPVRRRWRADVPGAVLTLSGWLIGSYSMRALLTKSWGGSSLYGPLSAPITLLLWLYLTSLMVLIGAAFNASVESVWPRISGITPAAAKSLVMRSRGLAGE
jgi:membrane protein